MYYDQEASMPTFSLLHYAIIFLAWISRREH